MRRLLLLLMALVWAPSVGAQTTPPDATLVTELQTAGYYELVDRARELGLPVTGGVPELRQRVADALKVSLPPPPASTSRTLTIDSAQEAGLVDVDAPGDGKLLRLSGGLQVTLVDNEKKVTHVIEAGELWYDQANEEMTARGKVVYTMIRETSREVFRGESLTFRLSDSQGVFYGGASDRSRAVGDQTLLFRYQGEAIRRSNGDLVVLDTGTITSSLGSDPYYRIQAKKIWVLAPGEWGLQDAVLYIGRIPVLYFPFFFQPGDEFFFNPVLSFPDAGDRRGTSLQTTTYFFGKKKRDAAPLSFLQLEDSSTKEEDRVRKGLFLVRGTPPPSTVPAGWTLRLLADFYSNLGFLNAVDATLPGFGGMRTFNAFAGWGVTRTVDNAGVPFSASPFDPTKDSWAQSDWNGSWLFGQRLPIRWGGSSSVDLNWGSFSLEYYSDTLLHGDLTGSRSENFSVFSLLGMGPAKKSVVASPKNSLQWNATVNLPPASVTSSLLWDYREASPVGPTGDPENRFYVPSQLTFPQASLTLSGDLWPPAKPKVSESAKGEVSDLLPPGAPEDPNKDAVVEVSASGDPEIAPPPRMESLSGAASDPQWATTANWSLKPTVKTDSRFDSSEVLTPRDSPWRILTSRWSGSYDGRLSWNTGWSDGAWSANQTFNLHQQVQDTWYLGDSVPQASVASYQLDDERNSSGYLNQTLGSVWKPWIGRGPWRESSLQYNLATKLWEEKFDTATQDAATFWFDGSKDSVSTHNASAQAVFYLMEGNPTLKAQAGWQSTLPPLDPLRTWSTSLDLTLPWGRLGTKASAKQSQEQWTWDPWDSTAVWTPDPKVSLTESFQYDLENSWPVVSTTSLVAWGFTTQYRHQRTTAYEFDPSTHRWKVAGAGQPQFLPHELRFGYSLDLPSLQWWYWRNTLSSKLTFSWPINLQKYSEMPLNLSYTLSYKLSRFLDVSISEGIVNRTAYLYFPALAETFGLPWKNPLEDLWQSISFWDAAVQDRTRNSLYQTFFKMTNLTVSLVHYLDDWQVKLDYTGAPQLDTAKKQYDWKGTLNFVVAWYPVPELKTQVQVDKEGNLLVLKNN